MKKMIVMVLFVCLVWGPRAHAGIPAQERQALTDIHTSMAGENWTDNAGWLGDVGTECAWEGITCDDENTHVIGIDLGVNNLEGQIPSSLGTLLKLEELNLYGNHLHGTIPRELGSLPNLWLLSLAENQLSGPVPVEMANLTSLEDNGGLDLQYNALYASDDDLRDFLSQKQYDGDWESTQTVAPADLKIIETGMDSVSLSWAPISYTAGVGGYEIWYAADPDADYALIGTTDDKTVENITIKQLSSGNTYYFRVRTISNISESDAIHSEYTLSVSATTQSDNEYHSADHIPDFRIDLSELLRFIQLYTNSTYSCASDTEDGYAPRPGDQTCSPHDGDYEPQDWHISLGELLRVIQFYSNRGYHIDESSEDGFAAGTVE